MKKLINAPETVLSEALDGFAAAHADIVALGADRKFVHRARLAPGKVALISGGGSGHEPLHGGFVGLGMLEARRGNAQRARDLTMKLAAIPEKQRVRDPWWAFHTARVPEDDLAWLRQAVRR